MALCEQALFTTVYEDVDNFIPSSGAVYIARSGIEDRSHHADDIDRKSGVLLVTVVDEDKTAIDLCIGASESVLVQPNVEF